MEPVNRDLYASFLQQARIVDASITVERRKLRLLLLAASAGGSDHYLDGTVFDSMLSYLTLTDFQVRRDAGSATGVYAFRKQVNVEYRSLRDDRDGGPIAATTQILSQQYTDSTSGPPPALTGFAAQSPAHRRRAPLENTPPGSVQGAQQARHQTRAFPRSTPDAFPPEAGTPFGEL